MVPVFVVFGCSAGPDAGRLPRDPGATDTAAGAGAADSGAGAATADTGAGDTGASVDTDEGLYPDQAYDCSLGVPPGPFDGAPVPGVVTAEDFAFDTQGFMVAADSNDVIVRYRSNGVAHTFAAAMASRGFELLPDGDIAVGDPNRGALFRVDTATGAVSLIGAVFPSVSTFAVDRDSQIYATYMEGSHPGRVTRTDVISGETTVLGTPTLRTYGAALSPDEQHLYISGFAPGDPTIYVMRRTPDGWGEAEQLITLDAFGLGGLATDTCGNIYATEPMRCRVWRADPAGVDGQVIGEIAGGALCAGLEFGSGFGGWDPTTLYVSTYDEVVAFGVGVPGRDR